jgi:hypothetical protein
MSPREESLLDANGEVVHHFQLEMGNLGFARMEDRLAAMLDSNAWRRWQDGLGTAEFLASEFDYFLTAIGVERDLIVKGVANLDVKARLDEHMDETRVGTDQRRSLEQILVEMPNRRIEPFGWTRAEGKVLQRLGHGSGGERRPLGSRVRQYRHTGNGAFPTERVSRIERLLGQLTRLTDDELVALREGLRVERDRRKRGND